MHVLAGAVVAEQLEFFPVPSPCRSICQTDSRGYCLGCLRSRDERFNWMRYTDSQKRDVLRLCHQRRLRMLRQQHKDEPQEPQQPPLF